MKHILAIDQGTSSSRAILFTEDGDIVSTYQQDVKLTYPQDGWVEQSPREMVDNTIWAVKSIIDEDAERAKTIAAIGITNQRETTIVWNRETGEPIYDAIVWQDRRTSEYCDDLRRDGVEDMVRAKTGLLLDPYFSATKVKWILDHVDGAQKSAENGDLLFGSVDTYLLWSLTKGAVHATDVSNASRTMIYNINEMKWDDDLLKLFNIPPSMLPEVRGNISDFGQLCVDQFGASLCVGGMAGDQQSAMIGQGCIAPGMVKSTYGTGCFLLMNMGGDAKLSTHKLLTTIANKVDGKVSYALEGAIFNAGTAIQFLRDNLGLFDKASETEGMAQSLTDNGGVYFVPAFTGLGAPYWNPAARGVICGLTRDTSKAHIVRAALEAQAFQTRDLIESMEKDSGYAIKVLRIDGGLVVNGFMCQFLADMIGVSVEVPRIVESTAWGAACLAGVQAGVFSSLEDSASRWQCAKRYEPMAKKEDMDALYSKWKKAVLKTY